MARIRSFILCLLLLSAGTLYARPSALIIPSVASDRFSIVNTRGSQEDYPLYDAVDVSEDGSTCYALSEYEDSVFYRIELQGLEKNTPYALEVSYLSDYLYSCTSDSQYQREYKVFAYPDVVEEEKYAKELGNDSRTLTTLSDDAGVAEVFLITVLPALDNSTLLKSGTYVTSGDISLVLRRLPDKAKVFSTSLHVMGRGYYNSGFYDFCSLDVRRTGMDVDLSDSITEQNVGEISTHISYTSEDTNSKTSIFLSSSPDPFHNTGKAFAFVHESVMRNDGSLVEDGKNSIGYVALLEGDGKRVSFDGKDALLLDNESGMYKVENAVLIENKAETLVSSNGVTTPVYTQDFEGRISLRINGNNEGLQGGRYTSDIYIHVFPAQ